MIADPKDTLVEFLPRYIIYYIYIYIYIVFFVYYIGVSIREMVNALHLKLASRVRIRIRAIIQSLHPFKNNDIKTKIQTSHTLHDFKRTRQGAFSFSQIP